MGYRSNYSINIEFREPLQKTFSVEESTSEADINMKLRSVLATKYDLYTEWINIHIPGHQIGFGIVDSRDNDEEILQFARDFHADNISYLREGDDREDTEEWLADFTTNGTLINKVEYLHGNVMEANGIHHRLWRLAGQELTTEDRVALELILSHYGI